MTSIDCEELIDTLHADARDQVALALLANVDEIVGMHLDLAAFNEEQARTAEEICLDA